METTALRFYITEDHPCSYLSDQQAKTAFLDPKQRLDLSSYVHLSNLGFRRSGSFVYKPNCSRCQACVPIRVPVALFKPNRKQKRLLRFNQDLDIHSVPSINTPEHYALYAEYIRQRHADGDMFPPSEKQYRDFLTVDWPGVQYLEFRKHNQLIAVSVADTMSTGISAMYTYFDPKETKRGLGNYVVLSLIELAKNQQLPVVYLGYWIKESRKMAYKSSFKPFEVLQNDQWVLIE